MLTVRVRIDILSYPNPLRWNLYSCSAFIYRIEEDGDKALNKFTDSMLVFYLFVGFFCVCVGVVVISFVLGGFFSVFVCLFSFQLNSVLH